MSTGHTRLHAQGTVKEGHLMLYDPLQAQWQRVFAHLSEATLSLFTTSSKFGRHARPPIAIRNVEKLYTTPDPSLVGDSSVAKKSEESAPSSRNQSREGSPTFQREKSSGASEAHHYTVIGVATRDGSLLVMRTAEPRLALDWASALQNLGLPTTSVKEMASMRSHFSPQLFAVLFRGQDGSAPSQLPRTLKNPDAPRSVAELRTNRGGTRIASVSADGPQRRMPARRTPLVAMVAPMQGAYPSHYVDPNAPPSRSQNSKTKVGESSRSGSVIASANTSAKQSPTRTERQAAPAMAKKPPTAPRSFGSEATPNTSHNSSPKRSASDRPKTEGEEKEAAKPNARTLAASVAPLPNNTASELAAAKAEIARLTAQNAGLEIDNVNSAMRVLELEGEITTLKDAVAEWRRRYQSLESQLSVQEQGFEGRLAAARDEVIGNTQAEVKATLETVREKWLAKESEYQLTIEQLEARLTA